VCCCEEGGSVLMVQHVRGQHQTYVSC
jgi:hypothetical protein